MYVCVREKGKRRRDALIVATSISVLPRSGIASLQQLEEGRKEGRMEEKFFIIIHQKKETGTNEVWACHCIGVAGWRIFSMITKHFHGHLREGGDTVFLHVLFGTIGMDGWGQKALFDG